MLRALSLYIGAGVCCPVFAFIHIARSDAHLALISFALPLPPRLAVCVLSTEETCVRDGVQKIGFSRGFYYLLIVYK